MKILPFTIEVQQLGKKVAARNLAYGTRCVYCGELATTLDHFRRPYMYDNLSRRRYSLCYEETETVPACRSCNSALGARCLPTIGLRAAWLYEWMLKHHGEVLKETLVGKSLYTRQIVHRARHIRKVACKSGDPCGELYVLLAELQAKRVRHAERIRRLVGELILSKHLAGHFESSDSASGLGEGSHADRKGRVG
jgi:hypothetical protein